MKKTLKFAAVILGLLVLSSSAYAAGEGSGNFVVNGLTKIVKFPVTILQKWGDSMDSAPSIAHSEDVAIAPIYDLDAETTG